MVTIVDLRLFQNGDVCLDADYEMVLLGDGDIHGNACILDVAQLPTSLRPFFKIGGIDQYAEVRFTA